MSCGNPMENYLCSMWKNNLKNNNSVQETKNSFFVPGFSTAVFSNVCFLGLYIKGIFSYPRINMRISI